jgi:hypothetical protein
LCRASTQAAPSERRLVDGRIKSGHDERRNPLSDSVD